MHRLSSSHALALFASICFGGALTAAPPADELLRLTPRDVTFVVVVKDLRTHSAAIREGPFAEILSKSKLFQALLAKPEIKHLDAVTEQISRTLHTDWTQVRDDLIGDAVVLAYRGVAPGSPDKESGLLLTWTRNAEFATQIIERMTAVQKESGELKEVETRSYQGASYVRRVKAQGADEFLFRKGAVLALSSQEEMIRRIIELDSQAPVNQQPPLARELESLRVQDAAVALWLNPRYFDKELNENARKAAGGDAAFLTQFASYWKAVSGVALSIRLERYLELSLSIGARSDVLPASLKQVGATLNEASLLSAMFPSDSLATVTGKIDLQAFLTTLSGFLPADAWAALSGSAEQALGQVLGRKYIPQLASRIGPDWGICIMPPASEKALLPDLAIAVRIQPSEGGSLEKGILDAFDSLGILVRLRFNSQSDEPVRIETIQSKEGDIKYLSHEKLFLPGLRPAWSLRNGFLTIGTSPDAIERVIGSNQVSPPAGPNRFLTFSFRQWHSYLTSRRAALISFLPTVTELKADEVASGIDELTLLFELFDRLELVEESQQPGLLKLSLKLYPLQPLKK
jgi:hypothetical protein